MKRIIILALLISIISVSSALAADWSQYESGRSNIRLDGYDGQTGYIKFMDGNGNINGILWISSSGLLKVVTPGALDLTTTKLLEDAGVGVTVGNQSSGI